MDRYATLAAPLEAVFARLTDPARLGDWLPQLTRVDIDPDQLLGIGIGIAFAVTTDLTGDQRVSCEVAAHEPPWLVAYRLMMTGPVLIRATCAAHVSGTRVHVHQTDGAQPLHVDLARLELAARGDDPARTP